MHWIAPFHTHNCVHALNCTISYTQLCSCIELHHFIHTTVFMHWIAPFHTHNCVHALNCSISYTQLCSCIELHHFIHTTVFMHWIAPQTYAAFRLACRLPHCHFDDDICTTAQAPLATEGWPSGKQRHANRSITLPLCPPRQIDDSWILFNSGAMLLGAKAKLPVMPLRAATLKQQAMITWHSGKAASGKLVWNQHHGRMIHFISWRLLAKQLTWCTNMVELWVSATSYNGSLIDRALS